MQQLTQLTADLPPVGSMPRRRKAALIVQMLFRDGQGIPLTRMPERLQAALAHELGAIRLVDKETVAAVAEEFLSELEAIGLVAPGNAIHALDELGDKIDPELSRRLRAEILAAQSGDPWPMIVALPDQDLIDLLETQSIQIGGVVLSKLSVDKAANALGKIDGARARRITFGMSQTANISPEAVKRIGKALVQEHCNKTDVAFSRKADARLGAILNTSPAVTRDDVLEGLESEDKDFADDVRRNIFTFADIATRIKETDIPLCIRNIEAADLETSIAAALASDDEGLQKACEYILGNMSQRMATSIREAAEELGKISPKVAEAAMNKVTATIREMEADGSISYVVPEEDEE